MDPIHAVQKPARNRLFALLIATRALVVAAYAAALAEPRRLARTWASTSRAFGRDQAAALGLPNFAAAAIAVVGSIVLAVVGMIVLAQLTPMYFGNFTNLLTTLTGTSTGNALADAIISIIILIVAIVGPIAFLGIAVAVVAVKFRGGST